MLSQIASAAFGVGPPPSYFPQHRDHFTPSDTHMWCVTPAPPSAPALT